jgi:hypothetical protein
MEASMRTVFTRQVFITAGVLALAATVWSSVQAAGNDATSATPAAGEEGKAGAHGRDVYGIVNLVSLPSYGASVNARGQAAFEYISLDDDQLHVGFFNGERTIDISPPDKRVAVFNALNEKGEVALRARLRQGDNPGPFLPFRWSPTRGLVPLRPMSPEGETFIGAMNNQGEIVGASSTADADNTQQAVRWNSANRLLPLPGVSGIVRSFAHDINERNVSVGYGYDTRGATRVLV